MTVPASAFVALTLALAPAVAPVPKGSALYHPTTVGDRWTYQYPDAEVTHVVTKVEDRAGRKVVSVGSVRDGKVSPYRKVEVSGQGLVQLESVVVMTMMTKFGDAPVRAPDGWKVHETPLPHLKLPARPGDKWEGERTPELRVSYTADAPERVKVPAGEYTAIPVDVVYTLPGRGEWLRWRYWYAPRVGVVKWTYDKGKGEVVLKSFTPGKE